MIWLAAATRAEAHASRRATAAEIGCDGLRKALAANRTQLKILLQCIAIAQLAEGQRKIITKVIPHYPELARPMRLEGTVKLIVSVAPNGSVKSMQAVGGNPLLLQAAQSAIQGWKWEPARQESQEPVELRFRPN